MDDEAISPIRRAYRAYPQPLEYYVSRLALHAGRLVATLLTLQGEDARAPRRGRCDETRHRCRADRIHRCGFVRTRGSAFRPARDTR